MQVATSNLLEIYCGKLIQNLDPTLFKKIHNDLSPTFLSSNPTVSGVQIEEMVSIEFPIGLS